MKKASELVSAGTSKTVLIQSCDLTCIKNWQSSVTAIVQAMDTMRL